MVTRTIGSTDVHPLVSDPPQRKQQQKQKQMLPVALNTKLISFTCEWNVAPWLLTF